MPKIKGSCIIKCFVLCVIGLLIYSKFVNLGWGLPYPMHPDERNMAVAIQSLNCDLRSKILDLRSCMNPHFFAYGQFPLYLGYLLIIIYKFLVGSFGISINFVEATLSLRIISALASVINVYVLYKIIFNKNLKFKILNLLIIIFTPFSIQFAHFGTTESLLMLFYSLIVYLSLRIVDENISEKKFIFLSSLFSGLAIATKVSSLIFLVIPIIGFISKIKNQRSKIRLKLQRFFIFILGFGICTLIFALVFSPHNLISWRDFISSIRYESSIGTGKILVFYTRQFAGTIPILFQFTKIFPYALGWPLYILFVLGFIFLSWKDKRINFLRLSFLIYFIPTAFLYAKWTRFMAPIFPIMIIFSTIFLNTMLRKIIFQVILTFFLILPGLFYLSIYQKPDVRFQASEWIYKHVPNNAFILSETANVADIPLRVESYKVYQVINFNFYDLDSNPKLQEELKEYLKKADYIIIPSRRIFMDHPKNKYPKLNAYYEKLFNGELGFKKVAEFSSGFISDEQAEETFTVFDHPVIRIYKKN